MLPKQVRKWAHGLIGRLVRAWDPDFTRLTPWEAARVDAAMAQIRRGEFVMDADIDWTDEHPTEERRP